MALERKTGIVPEWGTFEYATISRNELFSQERWKKTVEWDILFEQTEQIAHALSLLVKAPYPTQLFLTYVDILEANLYIFDDMFYYLTGGFLTDGIKMRSFDETWERLQFWNIDCHDTIMKIAISLSKSQNTFRNILQRDELKGVRNILDNYCEPESEELSAKISPEDESVYRYIRNIYEVKGVDIIALCEQIDTILIYLEQDTDYMFQWAQGWYSDCFLLDKFTSLLEKFASSDKGRKLVQGWEHELNKTREELIACLERDKNYQPWVYQYCHLSDKNDIIHELFTDENSSREIDEEKLNNTDNWINILSIATILQEYDKRQEIIGQLKPCFFNDEKETRSFYESIKGAEPKMITALVKKLVKDRIISDKSKKLYEILHKNGLYAPSYQNWNGQT